MIKILIADDHTIMRDGLKQILAGCSDLSVAGEADSGDAALHLIRGEPWDVAVLDMSMPGKSGIELIKQIKREQPALPVLVLSMHKEEKYAGWVLKAGASGYLCKDGASSQLIQAIRKVAAGGVFLTQAAAENMALGMMPNRDVLPHTLLSEREFQIFKRIAEGQGVTDIGAALHISVKTVSTHKARIMKKMEFESTAELVRYALKHDLTDDG
ncbi:MAG: response regulator transcription factor, partial [Betaproteobacteria bacterium]|nr:response regulator transcription factor [Betaproteobacteria bacterium]